MRRALVAMGGGYGAIVAATPVISALRGMDYQVDALVESRAYEASTLISGWSAVETIYLTRRSLRLHEQGRGYSIVARTIGNCAADLRVGPEARPQLREGTREVEANLSALKAIGWQGRQPACHVEKDEPFSPLPTRFFAIAPGCSRRKVGRGRMLWPHWERFCDLLHAKSGADVIALGEEEDEQSWMRSEGRPWLHCYCGVTSIRGAAGVISHCEGLYAVDNGLGWIGAALGRPVVSMFGPADGTLEGPEGEAAVAVSSTVPCRPCKRTSRWELCRKGRCMAMLQPEQVLNAGFLKGACIAG